MNDVYKNFYLSVFEESFLIALKIDVGFAWKNLNE
jgi:hypothetical protein